LYKYRVVINKTISRASIERAHSPFCSPFLRDFAFIVVSGDAAHPPRDPQCNFADD
jgi:hypothetical protein